MITTAHKRNMVYLLCALALAACGGAPESMQETSITQLDLCGDGTCDEGETNRSCAVDCPVAETVEVTPTEAFEPLGYATFVVKVSDFVHLGDGAATLLQLVDLFASYDIKAEFFLTGPMARLYEQHYPELVQRLTETGMAISYHVQPPHPCVPGFQAPLQGLPVDVTEDTIRNYESQALDLVSGALQNESPGGYQSLGALFGASPLAVSIPDSSIRGFALPILQQMGAQVVVLREGETTDADRPMRQEYGMWVRPADLNISHWPTEGIDARLAWWDMLKTEYAPSYQPAAHLQAAVESWSAERLPFIVVSIDEYNFYREGPVPWSLIFYQDPGMTQPKTPPYALDGPDPTSPRSSEDQAAVWQAYAAMVDWAATHLEVVTSAEIVELAVIEE